MNAGKTAPVLFRFSAAIIHWRGPSPFFFVPIPADRSEELRLIAKAVSYGWGVVPVAVEIAGVAFTTSLFPKDGGYLLPLKLAVRRALNLTASDEVTVAMTIGSG
ncbi:hypothetical protein sos41_30180 [Alphaproteobacteria bacterium SO-S41]|nr:hypothetical protein sos41_30180 [Alphaproteobacteria bacterium SO-S41]